MEKKHNKMHNILCFAGGIKKQTTITCSDVQTGNLTTTTATTITT